MNKKPKTAANIAILLILLAGVGYCVYRIIDQIRISANFADVMLEFVNLMPFLFVIIVIFIFSQLILTPCKKQNLVKEELDGEVTEAKLQKRIEICFAFFILLILVGGFGFYVWMVAAHAINCRGCSAHGSYPLIGSLFLVPLALLAAVVFGISRLILAVFRKKNRENTAVAEKE